MICNQCGEDKPETEFYPRNKKCKTCYKLRVSAYQKGAGKANHQASNRLYASTAKGSATNAKAAVTYLANNRKKTRAKDAVKRAVKAGKLVKGPCEQCGKVRVHGHHDDYDKPLVVRWLCPEHHKQWHAINGEGANATED